MIRKSWTILAALAMAAYLHAGAFALANQPTPAAQAPSTEPATQPAPQPAAPSQPAQQPGCVGHGCDYQLPHIAIATAAPAPTPWTWQEKVQWGAIVVLVVLGYVGILIALALLRKIERQTRYAETTAQAAAESAQAALKQAEAMRRAERPWVLMSVRPARNVENGFTVVATNRGRSPARFVSTIDEVVSATDEAQLSPEPVYRNQPAAPEHPIILLPGETIELLSFSRADVKRVCETAERIARVEKWEEKIYLYGKVVYRNLTAPDDAPEHESSWFCWYIHGREKSGMVIAGPPAYNQHT